MKRLLEMDIYEYEPSYDWYTFSQLTVIARGATNTIKPWKTYLDAAWDQGSPFSPSDAVLRSTYSFNYASTNIASLMLKSTSTIMNMGTTPWRHASLSPYPYNIMAVLKADTNP